MSRNVPKRNFPLLRDSLPSLSALVRESSATELAFIPHQIKDYGVGIPADLAKGEHVNESSRHPPRVSLHKQSLPSQALKALAREGGLRLCARLRSAPLVGVGLDLLALTCSLLKSLIRMTQNF